MNDTQATPPDVAVWKKLAIGTVGSVRKYRKMLKTAGFRVSDWTSDVLEKTPVATEAQELDLVTITVAELGFTGWTRYDEICRRAKERRLELCPAEVGPALRLAYTDQPMGEWLVVAMDHLVGSDGRRYVFYVERDEDGSWLKTIYGNPGNQWLPEYSFAFVRSPSPLQTQG